MAEKYSILITYAHQKARMMRKTLVFPCLILALAGCSKKEQARTEAPPPEPQEAREVAAVVSFVKGEARAFSGSDWERLAIGLELGAVDSLDIALDSQAELKGADGQTARLAGPARGTVSELMAAAAERERSAASKAVSKIKKLEGSKQSYEVQTPTAVAGIRGAPGRKAVPDTTKKDSLPEE